MIYNVIAKLFIISLIMFPHIFNEFPLRILGFHTLHAQEVDSPLYKNISGDYIDVFLEIYESEERTSTKIIEGSLYIPSIKHDQPYFKYVPKNFLYSAKKDIFFINVKSIVTVNEELKLTTGYESMSPEEISKELIVYKAYRDAREDYISSNLKPKTDIINLNNRLQKYQSNSKFKSDKHVRVYSENYKNEWKNLKERRFKNAFPFLVIGAYFAIPSLFLYFIGNPAFK